jgi:hypothetical protein
MLDTTQPPYIYEFYVRTVNITTDPATGKQSLIMATASEEVVNSVDIADVLRRPRTFITGWLEAHPYQKMYTGGVAPVPYKAEHFKKQENPINVLLMAMLQKLYTAAAEAEGSVTIPPVRSLEQIMLAAGWEFNIACVGDTEAEPHIASPEVWDAVKMSREYALLQRHGFIPSQDTKTEYIEEATRIYPMPEPEPEPEPEPVVTPEIHQRQNELEYKLDRLTALMETFINADNNSTGRRKRRAATTKRKAADVATDVTDEGRPALSVVKPREAGDLPTG